MILRFTSKVSFHRLHKNNYHVQRQGGFSSGMPFASCETRIQSLHFIPRFSFPCSTPEGPSELVPAPPPSFGPCLPVQLVQTAKSQLIKRLGSSPPVMTANYEMSCWTLPFYLISYSPAKLSSALWKQGKGSVSAAPAASLIAG